MYYVYILQSISFSTKIYIGFTENIGARLKTHNEGSSPHTSKYRPWLIKSYCAFEERETAVAFERYLKTHSGRAFIYKRFIIQ